MESEASITHVLVMVAFRFYSFRFLPDVLDEPIVKLLLLLGLSLGGTQLVVLVHRGPQNLLQRRIIPPEKSVRNDSRLRVMHGHSRVVPAQGHVEEEVLLGPVVLECELEHVVIRGGAKNVVGDELTACGGLGASDVLR